MLLSYMLLICLVTVVFFLMRARTASKVALVGKLFSNLKLEKKKTLCVVILTARSAFCLVTLYVAILYVANGAEWLLSCFLYIFLSKTLHVAIFYVANGAECFLSSYYRVFCKYVCLKPYMLLSYMLLAARNAFCLVTIVFFVYIFV